MDIRAGLTLCIHLLDSSLPNHSMHQLQILRFDNMRVPASHAHRKLITQNYTHISQHLDFSKTLAVHFAKWKNKQKET